MYKIGELSRISRLPVKTLRYYADIGLLIPDSIDRMTGYRYYSAGRVNECRRIVLYKELGFTLDEIKAQLDTDAPKEAAALVDRKLSELKGQLSLLESRIKKLTQLKSELMEDCNMSYHNMLLLKNVHFRTVSERSIYKTRREAINAADSIAASLPADKVGEVRIVINYENEYRERELDLEVCVEVTGELGDECQNGEKIIELAGDIASLYCDESELDSAYSWLCQQIYDSMYKPIGPSYEVYFGDKIELLIPIAPYCDVSVCEVSCCDAANNDASHCDATNNDAAYPGTARGEIAVKALPDKFENDPQAVGRWELVDILTCREQFSVGHPKCDLDRTRELYFLADGEPYWIYAGWTRGYVYTHTEDGTIDKNRYEISDGRLFLETYRHRGRLVCPVPEIWVYEKRSDESLHASDIRICDSTDYPYISDESVLGSWIVFDFYSDAAAKFDPSVRRRDPEQLYLRGCEFFKDGSCTYTTRQNSSRLEYTKGMVLNRSAGTASKYEIIKVGGREYLLLEWKSGDYTYGNGMIRRYVLVRG